MSFVKKYIELPEPQPPCYKTAEEMRRKYKYWRIRQLYSIFIGYSVYYFVRKNISIAVPLMETDLGLSKTDLGKILSSGDVIYTISKTFNGFLADRCNPRYFMAVGLLLSAVANFFFGMNAALGVLAVTWCLNGWFQGMGVAPASRIITHWFHPREIGWYWSLWALSNHVGVAVVLVLAGYLGQYLGWRFIFWVPAGLAGLTSLFLLERLRDTPASLGLPEPEVYAGIQKLEDAQVEPEEKQTTREFLSYLRHNVLNQPVMWAICAASFLDYVLCYAFVNWVPAFLSEKGMTLAHIGWMVTVFEVAGALAGMLGGWLTDKVWRGQRAPVCVGCMCLACLALLALWQLCHASLWICVLLLMVVGFAIYSPRMLVAIMATDLATKKAAASAVGMTALFGFAAGLISGWGLGHILDNYGWDIAFLFLAICSAVTIIPLACCWNLHPQIKESSPEIQDTPPIK